MLLIRELVLSLFLFTLDTSALFANGVFDVNFFRCMIGDRGGCPHQDIKFKMYTPKVRRGLRISVNQPTTLRYAGFRPDRETALIIHGFNGTEGSRHIQYLTAAYLTRKFNVITVDWHALTMYPCYISSVANTKMVAQCTAQMYAFLTHKGCTNDRITCVGHSLGAHICGMMSSHLTQKQNKIIGLDPARPLIEVHGPPSFRLTRDDARVVQIIHTNAGVLGQVSLTGSIDFCVNGGKKQPYCKGHEIRRNRCSHFLSVCYLANAIIKHLEFAAVPCPSGCRYLKRNHLPFPIENPLQASNFLRLMHIGQDTPHDITGTYCVQVDFAKNCPFN